MNRTVIFATLFTAIATMMVFSILPVTASHGVSGEISWINNAEKHGQIIRTDDGSNTQYQFNIPRDLQDGYTAAVGDTVNFGLDPANSRHATDVGFGTPGGDCPPHCGGSAF